MTDEDQESKWKAEKVGKISGSSLWKVLAKTQKGLYRAEREKYMKQLVAERLTGELTEFYKSKSMDRGSDEEFAALCAYELATGYTTTPQGKVFFNHPTIKMFGSSPDATVNGKIKGVELKNRDCDNHLDFLLNGEVPESAIYQCYAGMMCLEYDTWDYVSHDDRFIDDDMKIKIVTITRDENIVQMIEQEIAMFKEQLDYMIEKLNIRGK